MLLINQIKGVISMRYFIFFLYSLTAFSQIVNPVRPEVGQIGKTQLDDEHSGATIYGKEYKIWSKVLTIIDKNNMIVEARMCLPHPRSNTTRKIWIKGLDTSKLVDDSDVDIGDLNVKVSKIDSEYGSIFLFEIIDQKVVDDILDKKKQKEADQKELQNILMYLRTRSTDKKINEMIDRAIAISKRNE
jgi:hypothetical protein